MAPLTLRSAINDELFGSLRKLRVGGRQLEDPDDPAGRRVARDTLAETMRREGRTAGDAMPDRVVMVLSEPGETMAMGVLVLECERVLDRRKDENEMFMLLAARLPAKRSVRELRLKGILEHGERMGVTLSPLRRVVVHDENMRAR
jgi:hypothetical protein